MTNCLKLEKLATEMRSLGLSEGTGHASDYLQAFRIKLN